VTEEPEAVKEVRGVVPPTIPVIVTTPLVPPVKVKFLAPLMVLENEILAPVALPPAFVVSATKLAPKETGPVIEMAPLLVVKLPFKEIEVDPV
jgi:hypothetical protein